MKDRLLVLQYGLLVVSVCLMSLFAVTFDGGKSPTWALICGILFILASIRIEVDRVKLKMSHLEKVLGQAY